MTEIRLHTAEVTRQHAQEYIAHGWAVFLLAEDGSQGKIPPRNCPECDWRLGVPRHDAATCGHLLCHGFHAATADIDTFNRMLNALPEGHLAVRTGRASRLLVIDAEASAREGEPTGLEVLDEWEAWTSGKAGSLPYTLRARSVSGGQHWFYRLPDGVPIIKSGRIVEGIDVKCEFGYVGAVRGDGRRVWLNKETPVATAPAELLDWLVDTRRIGHVGRVGSTNSVAAPGYDFDEFLRGGCPDGFRDYFVNDLLFRLRKQNNPVLSRDELTQQLWDVWLNVAQPPQARYEMPWDDVLYKIDRVWAQVSPDDFSDMEHKWPGFGSSVSIVPNREDYSQLEIKDNTTVISNIDADESNELMDDPQNIHNDVNDIIAEISPRKILKTPPDFDRDLTQTGNAERFVKLFSKKALYVPGIGWHLWDGNAWIIDGLEDTFEQTKHVLRDIQKEWAITARNNGEDDDRAKSLGRWYQVSSSMESRGAMLRGAQTDPRMKVPSTALNSDPYLLVVPNGTLDLRTRKRRDSMPEDLNTQSAAVMFDPDATCPTWERHIELVTSHSLGNPDPVLAAYVQRWCGYMLSGLVSEQKFLFAFGNGSNGKNALIETILGLLGTYAIKSSSKLLMGEPNEHETIVAHLAGARMVFIDETPKGVINDTRLKELTGSSKITARLMRQNYFEFDMRAKIIISGNNKPRVKDTSHGFWRRLDLLPFDVTIPESMLNREFPAVLRAEWSGILNWCLDGFQSYQDIGLAAPDRVQRAGEDYAEEENPFAQFVCETFAQGVGQDQYVWHPNNLLHELYSRWCRAQGVREQHIANMVSLAGEWCRAGFIREPMRKGIQGVSEAAGASTVQRGWSGPPLAVSPPEWLIWWGSTVPKGPKSPKYRSPNAGE